MPKFEIRNTSHIGGLQFKRVIKKAFAARQSVGISIGEPGERRTRKGFLESRARVEVLQDIDEERFFDWVVESLHHNYQELVPLILHIKQIDDSEELDVPKLKDSEPFDIYGLGLS